MTWEKDSTDRVGRQLKKSRRARNMSAQSLADLTAELGYSIGRATISEYENGRRKSITVCELLILAAALDISPVALLYGDQLADGQIEVTPGVRRRASDALLWTTGEVPGRSHGPRLQEDLAVNLVRARVGIETLARGLAESSGISPEHAIERQQVFAQQWLHNTDQMKALGMIVTDHGDNK